MEVVTLDKLGRILLPKALRDEMGLGPGARLLAVHSEGKLVLKELDVAALARDIADEMRGVDIDAIARQIRNEAARDAAQWMAASDVGRERLRGGRQERPKKDRDP